MSQSKEEKKHFYLRHNDALMNSTKLSMKAKQSILLSKAENTVNAYESDWHPIFQQHQKQLSIILMT